MSSRRIPTEGDAIPHHRLHKINTRVRVKGGIRYLSLRYLRYLTEKGSCRVSGPRSDLNIYWLYVHEFIPKMESEGWTREVIVVEPEP